MISNIKQLSLLLFNNSFYIYYIYTMNNKSIMFKNILYNITDNGDIGNGWKYIEVINKKQEFSLPKCLYYKGKSMKDLLSYTEYVNHLDIGKDFINDFVKDIFRDCYPGSKNPICKVKENLMVGGASIGDDQLEMILKTFNNEDDTSDKNIKEKYEATMTGSKPPKIPMSSKNQNAIISFIREGKFENNFNYKNKKYKVPLIKKGLEQLFNKVKEKLETRKQSNINDIKLEDKKKNEKANVGDNKNVEEKIGNEEGNEDKDKATMDDRNNNDNEGDETEKKNINKDEATTEENNVNVEDDSNNNDKDKGEDARDDTNTEEEAPKEGEAPTEDNKKDNTEDTTEGKKGDEKEKKEEEDTITKQKNILNDKFKYHNKSKPTWDLEKEFKESPVGIYYFNLNDNTEQILFYGAYKADDSNTSVAEGDRLEIIKNGIVNNVYLSTGEEPLVYKKLKYIGKEPEDSKSNIENIFHYLIARDIVKDDNEKKELMKLPKYKESIKKFESIYKNRTLDRPSTN